MVFALPIDPAMFSWSKTWTIIYYVLLVALLAGGIYFFGRWSQYSIDVTIYDRRGQQGVLRKKDAGRIKKLADGTYRLHLKKNNVDLLLPSHDVLCAIAWSMGDPLKNRGVELYQYGEKSFTYIKTMESINESINEYKLKFVPEEQKAPRALAMYQSQRSKFILQDWFTKWGPLVLGGLMFATLVVMMIFVLNSVEKLVPAFQEMAHALAHAADVLSECSVNSA